MQKMNIPFSPPDISEMEIRLVGDALRSGWITTGLTWLVVSIVCLLRYASGKWKQKAIRSEN